MDQKLDHSSTNILPAQLLHEKLLSYQQNVDDMYGKNDSQNSSPHSDPRFSNGLLNSSLLESSLGIQGDCGAEKDDDDDVTIPGKN